MSSENLGEIATKLNRAGGEQVYLIVVPDCPFCAAMEDALAEHIDAGLVEVINVFEDEKGEEIVRQTDEDVGAPAVVVETDEGEYVPYQ